MKTGFTLIEMIIVIAICAILVSMFIPACNKVKRNSEMNTNTAPFGVVFDNDSMFKKETRFKSQTAGEINFCPRCGYALGSGNGGSPFAITNNYP